MDTPARPYDRNDNDTYIEIHSMDPALDVEAHMFANPSASVIGAGRIRGDFSVESRLKAANCVLHFPAAKTCGLVSLGKKLKLSTPMPMSLIKRYGRNSEGLCYAQQTPVFFDAKEERFVLLLDERFLRDIEAVELDLFDKNYHVIFKVYDAIPAKEAPVAKQYLGLLYESIEDMRKDADGSPLKQIREAYKLYNLRREDGEKVIILKVAKDKASMSLIFSTRMPARFISQLVRHQFQFEFTVAFKFGDHYYLEKPEGGIDQASHFILEKKRQQKPNPKGFEALGIDEDSLLLVIAYSADQHALLTRIHDCMSELARDITRLFEMHQQPELEVDAAINPSAGKLGWIAPLLGKD